MVCRGEKKMTVCLDHDAHCFGESADSILFCPWLTYDPFIDGASSCALAGSRIGVRR